ncbi:MAG: chemotaxis protein CheW [Bdellovibrionales bacterium]
MTVPKVYTGTAVALANYETRELVSMVIAGQSFGIPVLQVQDVLQPQHITHVPLAPPEIAGVLNLRGRIVTAIDVRARLNLARADKKSMNVVVQHNNETYSLLVDKVGDVLSLPTKDFELPPPTMDACWREVAEGIYRLDGSLMIVLDIDRLLAFTDVAAEETEAENP